MTDKEIIKALECCMYCNCKECPCYVKEIDRCKEIDEKEIFNLINRLKGESNKYRNQSQAQKAELTRLYKQVTEQKAEIERLNDLFDSAQDNNFIAMHLLLKMRKKFNRQKVELDKKDTEIDILIRKKESLRDEISELKAEIERLQKENDELRINSVTKSELERLNNLVKEMTEGNNENTPQN
jgi:chromosome segregation ATPase